MEIHLQLRSKTPIYEQIVAQAKEQIIQGKLKDGDPVPSIRALAKTLQVSVITVQKAYEELQRSQLIESLAGRGTFIKAPDNQALKAEYLGKIKQLLTEVKKLAIDSNIPMAEIIKLVEGDI